MDPKVTELLAEFGPPRWQADPEHPLLRLQNDAIWVVPEADAIRAAVTASGHALARVLHAGLSEGLSSMRAGSPGCNRGCAGSVTRADMGSSAALDPGFRRGDGGGGWGDGRNQWCRPRCGWKAWQPAHREPSSWYGRYLSHFHGVNVSPISVARSSLKMLSPLSLFVMMTIAVLAASNETQ